MLIVGVIREVFAAPTLHYDRPHAYTEASADAEDEEQLPKRSDGAGAEQNTDTNGEGSKQNPETQKHGVPLRPRFAVQHQSPP